MTTRSTTVSASELVPLNERLGYLDIFRAAAALLAAVGAIAWKLDAQGPDLVLIAGIYGAVALAGGVLWRALRRRALTLFGTLIIIDGVYLAWVTYATGGTSSPFRYLILMHLVAVALLASYRTSLKLALWHTLLLMVTYHLAKEGILPGAEASEVDAGAAIAFSVVFWLMAFLTATLAAVNERELRRRKFDLEALAVMTTELETTSDPTARAEVFADNMMRHFDVRRVAVLRTHHRKLATLAVAGDDVGPEQTISLKEGSVVFEALRAREPRLVTHIDPGPDRALDALLPDARNLSVFPMTSAEGLIGVVIVEHGANIRAVRRAIDMIERFVSHGSMSIRNAELLKDMERLASVDSLTGVGNRRTFDAVLAKEIKRAERHDSPVSLILADIDHFKQLNDKYGHKEGDRVLKRIAMLLERGVREVDTVVRYGGEEFAVIMPHCKSDEAAARAEQLRETVRSTKGLHGSTVSFGIATHPIHGVTPETVVNAADEALYAAKVGGRDRSAVFALEEPAQRKPARKTRTSGSKRSRTRPVRKRELEAAGHVA